MTRTHEVTVVVALIPGGDCIDDILAGLGRQQNEPRFGLIIVDARPATGGAGGLAAAAAAARLDAHVVPLPGAARASCNNLGIRLARTAVVLLLAHDFSPAERFVSDHLALHRQDPDSRVVGIGPGRFRPELRRCPFRRWLEDSGEAFGTSFTAAGAVLPRTFFYCANVSAKRSFLLETGLFDERFPYDSGDDAELGARLARGGMRSVLVPEGVAWHEHPVTVTERHRTMRRAGESAAIHEAIDVSAHAWQAWARQPLARLRAAARWRLMLSRLVPGHSRLREEGWRRDLAASFAAGYQAARATTRRTLS